MGAWVKPDNSGSSSFAFIAVLLFLSMVLVHAYMGRLDVERSRMEEEARQALEARDAAWKCYVELRSQASFSALSALALGRHTGADPEEIFLRDMEDFVQRTFPRNMGGTVINVANHSWRLGVERAQTTDIVPVVDQAAMRVEGRLEDRVSATRNSALGNISAVLSPRVLGSLVLESQAGSSSLRLEKELDIPLGDTYPFQMDRVNMFEAGLHGGLAGAGRTVQYILTTLAQYRIFQGTASPGSNTTIDDVLSEQDLEMAVNLAVYMEQLKAFRTLDPVSVGMFDERNMPLVEADALRLLEAGTITSVGERSLSAILGRYMRDGSVDPADLMALFLCLDSGHISIDMILAQSLHTIFDQLVLKYMTYFGLPARDPETSGYATSTGEAAAFSNSMLTQMKMPSSIWERPKTFDTGEVVTTVVIASRQFITPVVVPYINTTTSIPAALIPRGFPNTEPNTETLPVGSRIYYSPGEAWVEIFLEMDIGRKNTSFSIVLESRETGSTNGAWHTLLSRTLTANGSAIENTTIKETMGQAFPAAGMETRLRITDLEEGGGGFFHINATRFELVEYYEGTWVNKTTLTAQPNPYFQSISHNIGALMQGDGSTSAAWEYLKNMVHTFFAALVQTSSSLICSILFGESRPSISIDPWDGESLTETMRTTSKQWMVNGINGLRAALKDRDTLEKMAQGILDAIISGMVEKLKVFLDNLFAGVSSFVEAAKNHLVNRLCSVINTLGGAAAAIIHLVTFGIVDRDDVRDRMSGMVYAAADYWDAFETRVRAALSTVIQSVQSLVEKCVDAVASVLANLVMRLGGLVDRFLGEASSTVAGIVDYMMKGSAVAAVEYRETMVKGAEHGAFLFENDAGGWREHSLEVKQTPAYLSPETGIQMTLGMPMGMHYTDPGSISQHPYEAVWQVSARGSFALEVHDGSRLLTSSSPFFSSCPGEVELNISVPVTVFSGWPLEGLDYEASRTFIDDMKSLLQKGWDKLSSMFEGLIHFMKKAADIFSRLVQEVMSRAMWIVDSLETVFQNTMELMARLLTSTGYKIASQLIGLLSGQGGVLGPIAAYGYTFTAVHNNQDGTLDVSLGDESSFRARMLLGSEDSSMHVNMSFWHIEAQGCVSSLIDREYNGVVKWNRDGAGWQFDFHGPENYTYSEAKLSISSVLGRGITVPTPAGPATIDIGIILRMDMERINASVEAELGPLGGMLLAGPGAMADRLGGNESTEAAVDLAKAISVFMLDGDPLRRIMNVVEEVSASTTVEFFIDVKFGAEGTGMGFTLSLVIHDPVFVLLDIISWVHDTLGNIVGGALREATTNTGGTMTASPGGGLSTSTMENISVRLSLKAGGDMLGRDLSLGVEANLPALGVLAEKNWGVWRIDISLYSAKIKSRGQWLDEYEVNSTFVGLIEQRVW